MCKNNENLMSADADKQLEICRKREACDICSCECPGGGKWVEGDEQSRMRFREKARDRYEKLTGVLKTSWDGKHGDVDENNTAGISLKELPKRLPADIQNQIAAVTAAHSLLGNLVEERDEDHHEKHCTACSDTATASKKRKSKALRYSVQNCMFILNTTLRENSVIIN